MQFNKKFLNTKTIWTSLKWKLILKNYLINFLIPTKQNVWNSGSSGHTGYITLVKICLQGSKGRVLLGTVFSEDLSVANSLKHGDALSPLLFKLVLEYVVVVRQVQEQAFVWTRRRGVGGREERQGILNSVIGLRNSNYIISK